MVRKDPEKCVSTGKIRNDRVVQSRSRFEPLKIEIKYPDTAIWLLQCQEKSVLIAAAAALSKFGSKSLENLEALFDLDILDTILPLIEDEDLYIRRFATKLLAEMSSIATVKNHLLESNRYISHFTKVLANDTDVFIQEFSSLILDELSKDMFGVAQLLQQDRSFDFLFHRIQSPDPDVKRNTIGIMSNLLKDPAAAQKIVNSKDFSFSVIYELFKQPYPATQLLALGVVEMLVARSKDENIEELFRESGGLQALLAILDSDEFWDLHSRVLQILVLACDNAKTVEHLNAIGEIRRLFNYMEQATDSKILANVLSIIVRFANTSQGRKALYAYGIVDNLLGILKGTASSEMYGASCYGIARMTQYRPAADDIAVGNPLKEIIGLMKNENMQWSIRQVAANCLAELLVNDCKNCQNLLAIKGQSYLLWLIRQPTGKVPMETQITAIRALMAIGGSPDLRDRILDSEMIEAVYVPLESKNPITAELRVACCNILSLFSTEKKGREIFRSSNGPKKMYNLLLESESVPVRNAAAQLIQQMCSDTELASLFVNAGCLEYMLEKQTASRIVPSWSTCIEALFSACLPAKFALTGRLSLHDLTKDGFYIMRRNTSPFPNLEEMFAQKICPMQPIYVCNFTKPPDSESTMTLTNEVTTPNENKNMDSESVMNKHRSSRNSTDTQVLNCIMDEKFGKLQMDPFLYEYLELFKCKLIASEPKEVAEAAQPGIVNIGFIKSRAKMLGQFVAQKMSGPDPTAKCIDHQLELHLNEVKIDIGRNVIPLGKIRVGMQLERALLFKVIADRICLPAALVRGEYGRAWIEIAAPEVFNQEDVSPETTPVVSSKSAYRKKTRLSNNSSKQQSSDNHQDVKKPATDSAILDHRQTVFPTKLLRPNYIVDLMQNPGELLPLNTKRANEYCGRPISL